MYWYFPNVLFLNLIYCSVQYNTANYNKNNYSAPVSRLWYGTGKEPLQHHRLYWPWPAGVKSSRMPDVLVSLFTNKIVKKLSHVINITVLSVSITWCKLRQQFGWQSLYWRLHFLCITYIRFKSTNLHITVCGILIEKDWIWFTVRLLLVVWPKNQQKKHHPKIII